MYTCRIHYEALISACIIESVNLGRNMPRSAPTYVVIMRRKAFDFWAHVENPGQKETVDHS